MPSLSPPPPGLLDGAALFLDFDGTLVELAEAPDAIRVAAELGPLLERLRRRLQGRLAIVSGRSIGGCRGGWRSSAAARSPISNGTCLCPGSPFPGRTGSN